MRPLNSDALGEKGELRFAEMCTDAGLFCNKASRDRTGWDFLVEFPFDPPSASLPLDRRPQPADCRIQVKTAWTGSRNIRLRLSSAERLAKLLQPTAIVVLTTDNDLRFTSMYCLHVIDNVLEAILREIRRCQKTEQQVNKTFTRLDFIKLGIQVPLCGQSIKQFIQGISGASREAYVDEKSRQIRNLGVIGNRYSGRLTLFAQDDREFSDIMLGLKSGLVKSFSTNESRWGVSLPVLSDVEGRITFAPTPRKGQIVLRGSSIKDVVKTDVGIIVPPASDSSNHGYFKIRMVNAFLEVTLEQEAGSVKLTSQATISSQLSLREHVTLNLFQTILGEGAGTLEIMDGRNQILKSRLGSEKAFNQDQHRFGRKLLSKLQKIVEVGGTEDVLISVDEVNTQLPMIFMIYDLIAAKEVILNPLSLTATSECPNDLSEVEALIVGRVVFGEVAIAWCAIAAANISGEAPKVITLGPLDLRQVDRIGGDRSSFQDFTDLMRDETALHLLIQIGG